ncbi:unnamed protein product, partial [Mesorhabditis belari]|uniref:Uncharacterized protein n=1 Tax=Mesorhabditis belari TaxID=2138241 RepID=A0AAF3EIP6_9BILA
MLLRVSIFLLTTIFFLHEAAIIGRDSRNEDFREINEDGEVSPPIVPRMNSDQKWDLIRKSGQNPEERRRPPGKRGFLKKVARRDLLLTPWRITHVLPKKTSVPRPMDPPVAVSIDTCPKQFDAITKAYNQRTYAFAGSKVYQVWYENNLPQKASFELQELFPGGPRQVTAVLTNSRSGVTTLFDKRKAYRFRWNKKAKRFHMTKNRSPQDFSYNITITPDLAFEWFDGNQVIVQDRQFAIYDAYWNLATFTGDVKRYFPNLPRDLIGIIYSGGDIALLYTRGNKVKVYETKKYRVVQEYPVKIGEFVGCL